MKSYDNILFDLDGTLTDSGPGIMNAVDYALKRFGIEEPDRQSLRRFVGPPLNDSFMLFYGFSPENAEKAVWVFREYYNDTGIYENSVYPGVEEALRRLSVSGKRLAVATSKPEALALRVLERFDLKKYFTFIVGSTYDNSRLKKADVVAHVLKEGGIAPAAALMVGDREHDIAGGKANGLDTMGVLFGYGSLEELQRAGADYIAETASDIAGIILS